MKGKVKFFKDEKQYGFITAEDGKEYFFHGSKVEEGQQVGEEDEVTFDVEQGAKGPNAVNVKKA